jgi:hypothetical protein
MKTIPCVNCIVLAACLSRNLAPGEHDVYRVSHMPLGCTLLRKYVDNHIDYRKKGESIIMVNYYEVYNEINRQLRQLRIKYRK